MHRVLVVGQSDAVAHVVEQFDREPGTASTPSASASSATGGRRLVDERRASRRSARTDPRSVLRTVDDLRAEVVAVASDPDLSGHALRRLAWALDERDVDLIVSPGIVEVAGPRLSIRPVAGLSLLHVERPVTRGGRDAHQARRSTGCSAASSSSLLSPAARRHRAGRPAGPRRARCSSASSAIGEDGRPFEMLKFRSMVVDAEERRRSSRRGDDGNGVLFKMQDDPRVTRVGAVLRRFSLDELPQLLNVLRGRDVAGRARALRCRRRSPSTSATPPAACGCARA